MVADPASLPAVNSIVASLPDELEIRLWLGRQHEGDEQLPLASHPRLSATWVPHAELTERVAAELDGVHGWFGWVCVDTAQTRALKRRAARRHRSRQTRGARHGLLDGGPHHRLIRPTVVRDCLLWRSSTSTGW